MFARSTKLVFNKLLSIAILSDSTSVRFVLAVAEIIWAISLLWPGDTFDRPTYDAMASVMAEEWWGLLFLGTGIVQIYFVMLGRYHTCKATAFAAWNSFLWWFVVLGMYASVYPPPAGISGELALAFAASWVLCKTGKRFDCTRETL